MTGCQKFGPPHTREILKREISEYLGDQQDQPLNKKTFYLYLDKLLEQHHLNPFQDTDIALVGMYAGYSSTVANAGPILNRFHRVQDISALQAKDRLGLDENLAVPDDQKVDYLVTGNVINAPDNLNNADTLLACSNHVKKDGRIIHMLGYGEREHSGVIEDEFYQKLAGQQRLINVPDHPYHPGGYYMGTEMMMLAQKENAYLTQEDAAYHAGLHRPVQKSETSLSDEMIIHQQYFVPQLPISTSHAKNLPISEQQRHPTSNSANKILASSSVPSHIVALCRM